MENTVHEMFALMVDFLRSFLFWDPFAAVGLSLGVEVPFIVVWLLIGALFFTVYFRFINVRGFKHALQLVSGRHTRHKGKGETSPFQAVATALSSTVGLGNIAGVAIAISMGGPGATFWMILAGFLGMSSKFAECTLGVKYRTIDANGMVSGGPMYYLKRGLAKRGMPVLGKFLAGTFALMIAFSTFGIGNMFQANQIQAQLSLVFPMLEPYAVWVGLVLAGMTGLVILGGIKRIASTCSRLFPFMALLYVGLCLLIVLMNISHVGRAFILIWDGAFHADAVHGGFVGVMIMGLRRAVFSNEAGIGSSAIAHATVKTKQAITEGYVALLEPFIDTVVICTLTALTLIVTGLYQNPDQLEGAQLTSAAFATLGSWAPYVLLLCMLLFVYSTLIGWSYYGVKGFDYLFGGLSERLTGSRKTAEKFYQVVFLMVIVLGTTTPLALIIDFSDMLVLAMSLPNLIGLYLMAPEIKRDLLRYKP
ncbi:MAG TPA: alanine/glycine:cation symporter family protein [Bacteroidales bacterium]|nr:alanine/glycine:cation symporter family protein [Bacteroidales bacterium]